MHIFVGTSWWGVGAPEMARATPYSSSAVLWNLTKRTDRLLMNSPLQLTVAGTRLRTALKRKHFQTMFLTNPHRVSAGMIRHARKSADRIIALLGDAPVGERRISNDVLDGIDLIALPDVNWAKGWGTSPPIVQAPWRSTVVSRDLFGAPMLPPHGIAFVGTAYPERVRLARKIAEIVPVLTIGRWPGIPGAEAIPALPREDTLRFLRSRRVAVVNVLHQQFSSGLNPQYFDYLACGIPQVVVNATEDVAWIPTNEGPVTIDLLAPDAMEAIGNANEFLRAGYSLSELSFAHTIERVLNA